MRDLFSGFAFFNALNPIASGAGAINGHTIDLLGYDACTFVMCIGSQTTGGVMTAQYNNWRIQMGLDSATGVSAWSDVVYTSHILASAHGRDSVLTSGIWCSYASTEVSTVMFVGFVGDGKHRYVRLVHSQTGTASVMSIAAIAILGRPANWPVQEPGGDL